MVRVSQGSRLHAQTSFYANRVEFWLFAYDPSGNRLFASDIEFGPYEEGSLLPPSFSLPFNIAQEFFEELWRQGFRSAHDKGNAEALDTARKEHIADLRKAAKLG